MNARREDLAPQNPLLRFLVVGAANTAAGLALILFFKHVLGLGDITSNVLGYAIIMPIAFSFNRRWTFSHKGHAQAAFGRYLLTLATAYATNLTTVMVLIGASVPGDLAQVFGVAVYAAVGYVGSKHFAFRQGA